MKWRLNVDWDGGRVFAREKGTIGYTSSSTFALALSMIRCIRGSIGNPIMRQERKDDLEKQHLNATHFRGGDIYMRRLGEW